MKKIVTFACFPICGIIQTIFSVVNRLSVVTSGRIGLLPLSVRLIFFLFAIYIALVFAQGAPCGFSYKTFQEDSIPGYKQNDLQLSQMKMYNLTYGHYEKIKESKIC